MVLSAESHHRGRESSVRSGAQQRTDIERVFEHEHRDVSAYLRPLRPQQWLKNLLVVIPLLAAHRVYEMNLVRNAILAFVAFGCCASSGYVVNDLLDLAADRQHPQKRLRPFASGDLPLHTACCWFPV